jgi:hypothetical protein
MMIARHGWTSTWKRMMSIIRTASNQVKPDTAMTAPFHLTTETAVRDLRLRVFSLEWENVDGE